MEAALKSCGQRALPARRTCLVLATLLVAQAAHAATPDFDAAIREAQGLLRSGQAQLARSQLEALLGDFPRNPEALALLAASCEATGQLERAAGLYDELLQQQPGDPELQRSHVRVATAMALAEARRLRDAGDMQGALKSAQALLDAGRARYDAGLLAARAHAMLRQHREAAALYGELAQHYPEDPELPAMQVRALVDAREPQAARAVYDRLGKGAQALATQALGGSNAALYTNSINFYGLAAASTAPIPQDQAMGALLAQRVARGTLTLFAETDHRFGANAQQYGGGYEFPIAPAWGAWFTASTSPQRSFLPGTAVAASVNRSTARTMTYLTLQQLAYATSSAFVLAPGLTLAPGETWSLDARIYYVPGTHAHSLMLAPQWLDARGNRIRLTLAAGMLGENLGVSGGVLRAPSQSVRLDGTWRLGARLGVNAGAFHEHRQGLYDRSGLQLGLAWWW
jgi:YaiO family outer membrane protein